MFEFGGLLGFIIAGGIAGVVLSIIQEVFKGAAWIGYFDQRKVAIGIAILAGVVAYVVEFVIGFDLFGDVDTVRDIAALIMIAFSWGQATYNLALRRA